MLCTRMTDDRVEATGCAEACCIENTNFPSPLLVARHAGRALSMDL